MNLRNNRAFADRTECVNGRIREAVYAFKFTCKNLALIQEAEVEFGPGLNILTGETGAGKSILIGSINLALGKKLSREMIREGETSALVELVFDTENPKVEEALKAMEIESMNGQVLIVRKITGGRSISKINGETCTAAQVRQIASILLDIHGQHEHQSLLYPDRQLDILDAYGKEELEPVLARVKEAFRKWKELQNSLKEYELDEMPECGKFRFWNSRSVKLRTHS